ncbi:MAG: TlpA disulfide reductase family protein [Paludibacter sp.]|nr:TlpA disulfide reductase family protein [Paludibacter sp.]
MKRIAHCIFSIVLFICCTPNHYKIEGITVNQDLNGQTVFIKERINRVWNSIDSVNIEHGKFSFQGTCDSSRVVYMFCTLPSGENIRKPFVLESGKISVKLDGKEFTFSGTKQNDLLQTYQNGKNDFFKRVEANYFAIKDITQTDEQKAAYDFKIQELNNEEVAYDLKYVQENVNTIVGTHIFVTTFYGMSIDQKDSIIVKMNDNTKKIARIQEIINNIAIEKKTAKGSYFTDIKLPGLKGDSLSLSALIGKTDYVLIDFWASWCGPCIQSLPELKKLYNSNKGKKLEILGVSLDNDGELWRTTVSKKELNWKHVSDLQGWKSSGAKLYAVSSIPATVLINKDGIIEGRNLTINQIELIIYKSSEKK